MTAATASLDLKKHFEVGTPVGDWFLGLERGTSIQLAHGQNARFLEYVFEGGKLSMKMEVGHGPAKHMAQHTPDYVIVPKSIRRQPIQQRVQVARRW